MFHYDVFTVARNNLAIPWLAQDQQSNIGDRQGASRAMFPKQEGY
jgi:hypothetical protein